MVGKSGNESPEARKSEELPSRRTGVQSPPLPWELGRSSLDETSSSQHLSHRENRGKQLLPALDTNMGHRASASMSDAFPSGPLSAPVNPNRTEQSDPSSPTSPSSINSRRRERGLSLRSQIFSRNISSGAHEPGLSPIELSDQRSSSEITPSKRKSADFRVEEHAPRLSNDLNDFDEDVSRQNGRSSPRLSRNSFRLDRRSQDEPRHGDIFLQEDEEDGAHQANKKSHSHKHSPSPGLTSQTLPNYSSWAVSSRPRAKKIKDRIVHAAQVTGDFILRKKHAPPSKGGRSIPIQIPHKKIPLVDERTGKPYVDNNITSSIYTPYNFLPRQIIYQFSKLANLYFLFVSILQMIPSWSATGSYTTIIPLMIFLSISMGREGYDDWRRHRQDKTENRREVKVAELNIDYESYPINPQRSIRATGTHGSNEFGNSEPIKYTSVKWSDLRVGDVIRLEQNDWVPADIILLQSSGEDGVSYVETMALDGETNLKSRQVLPELAELCDTPEKLAVLKSQVLVEDPNMDLYNFEATMTIDGKDYPLSSDHVIYRGSILRNTPSVLGMVVFSGEESKIRMNAIQNVRSKSPRLQTKVNKIVVAMVVFVILLSVFCTVASRVYYSTSGNKMWYLRDNRVGWIPNLMGFIIMFNTLIPLSLYVEMEIIKVVQVVMLQQDLDMYHKPSNTPCESRTASINEELGQVSYIFSDKTGTLTDNVMIFRKFTVAGYSWLHDLDIKLGDNTDQMLYQKATKHSIASAAVALSPSYSADGRKSLDKGIQKSHPRHSTEVGAGDSSPRLSTDSILRQVALLPRKSQTNAGDVSNSSILINGRPSIASARSLKRTTTAATWKSTANPSKVQHSRSTLELLDFFLTHPSSVYARKAKFFILAVALCHSCIPEIGKKRVLENGQVEIDDLTYQAASPDELSLVSAARDLGYIVIDKSHGSLTIRTYPQGFDAGPVDEVYEILETVEFSSARKRMTTVVKFPDGRIVVFCKGADNVIMERLRSSSLAMEKAEEISKQALMRKAAEADVVIARNSTSSVFDNGDSNAGARGGRKSEDVGGPGRLSFSRPSLNIDRHQALASLDSHLQRAHQDEAIEQIAENARRSFTMSRQRQAQVQGSPSNSGGSDSGHVDSKPQRVSDLSIDDHLALNESYVMEETLKHIEEFSSEGLRTLMYAYRWMDREEYNNWIKLYKDARTSLVDRQEKIEKVGEMIEHNFELCGATAIEDKLQEGVPETIDRLRRANIRLWMLTGDKRETAINIGYSCRLIKDYSTVVVLKSDEGDIAGRMAAAMLELDSGNVAHCVVVIDGGTLSEVQKDVTLLALFIDLGVKADSVICCRASPSQKAAMVKAVRKKVSSAITLAIGDGANDIAMIQSADVGIGITGKEGLQAARSSDFSIAQFRYLTKLLLVHGRWNYVRTCKYVVGTFYKEFMFYLTQAIFQRNTMFTGTSLYESWSLSMFNTLFTSLPVLCIGIFEQDLTPATLVAVPELYTKGQRNQGFGSLIFLGWMIVSTCQSVLISFLDFYIFGLFSLKDNTLYPLGVVSFTVVVALITTKLQIFEMHLITSMNLIAMVLSFGGWLVWNMFLAYIYSKKPSKIYLVSRGIFEHFGTEILFWATILVIYSASVTFELIVRLARNKLLPNDTDTFQILEKDPLIKQRLEEEAYDDLHQGWEQPLDCERAFFGKIIKRKGWSKWLGSDDKVTSRASVGSIGSLDTVHSSTPMRGPNGRPRSSTASSAGVRHRPEPQVESSARLTVPEPPQQQATRKRDKIREAIRSKTRRKNSADFELEVQEILRRRALQEEIN